MTWFAFYALLPDLLPMTYLAHEELVSDLSEEEIQMLYGFICMSHGL